ncbi:MAG: hypothetical protein MUE61_08320 [Vicinamibacterales bacterium]|jgi:hypothetical protein|nr:hypothetical protein [Vicinamibacterales bacterium]MCU0477170.1 hypothetical protein [Chloroflexota bacterium]MCU0562314.1 hypothetical protein [Desulfobacterales bacterium]
MTTADLRRLYRAARAVDTIPARRATLEQRYAAAETALRVALAQTPTIALPGYRIAAGPDGAPIVTAHDIPADQLALWRELAHGAAEA